MQACIFPLELCKAIIEAIPSSVESSPPPYTLTDNYAPLCDMMLRANTTLWACSLTCRAWRKRSQALLWRRPIVSSRGPPTRFYAACREGGFGEWTRLVTEFCLSRSRFHAHYPLHHFPELHIFHTRRMDCQ
ncbi:hypothetical protein PYCCODRAFT_961476 [Trametes coccinea BRFM310]|uniref:Uncharacterized protein n=1 Tax=Trametes coccinea (strain BRFM310) TaxID=1353009 RepID=A0A1Y2J031_TRAC3|nr:hypothetical protein PYCCODRAFT_961476 [Trametes coccinea BRFM310]